MEVHVGNLIERRLEEIGMTKAEFGRRIKTSRQNVNSLLRKKSLDTAFLQRICDTLKYDFFKHFAHPGQEIKAPSASSDPEENGRPVVKILIEIPRAEQDHLLDIVLGRGRLEMLHKVFQK